MLWVLWDIFLPVLASFLVGLFVGWMFWRWRRSRIDAETLSALRRNTTRLKNDADNLRARNAELSDRLQTASVTSGRNAVGRTTPSQDSGSSNDLTIAKKRIDTLSDELKSSRLEVNRLKDARSTAGAGKTTPAGQQAPRVRDLEARLQGANRRIADLENANREMRNTSVSHTRTTQNTKDFSEAIESRDRMIETLKQSLAQYGDSKDLTSLSADLVLRENKIDALESLLEGTNQKIIK